jgi:hypothetical protein
MRPRGDHPREAESARREKILREELERRLEFFESCDDSELGAFTTVDWLICTLLFFLLPLLILGLMLV